MIWKVWTSFRNDDGMGVSIPTDNRLVTVEADTREEARLAAIDAIHSDGEIHSHVRVDDVMKPGVR